jgi:hypothetical protein
MTLPMPVAVPTGTDTTIEVSLHPVMLVADPPLIVTELPPMVAPKLVPLMVIVVLAGPEEGDTPVMLGRMVKAAPLLATPPTVTTTFPEVAPAGTVTASEVSAQLLTVAVTLLNFTVFDPCSAPKLVPVIVTEEPAGPEFADKLVMLGGGITLKADPALD